MSKKLVFNDEKYSRHNMAEEEFLALFGVTYSAVLRFDEINKCSSIADYKFDLEKAPSFTKTAYYERLVARQKKWADIYSGIKIKNWLYADKIEKSFLADVYVSKVSETVGYGLFASSPISTGSMIGEYTGLVRARTADETSNHYLFNYEDDLVIDAEKIGNLTRFINHSSQNANTVYLRVVVDGIQHIVFVARRRISRDEQILFDYGDQYWIDRARPDANV